MKEEKFFGPYLIKHQGQEILSYFTASVARRISVKVFYGCAFFYVPRAFLAKAGFDGRNSEFGKTEKLDARIDAALMRFLDESRAVERFARRGVYLKGEMYMTKDYAYVLGVKRPISYKADMGEDCLNARDYVSAKTIYRDMALYHFKERVQHYRALMGIRQPLEVGLSDSIYYLGLNYFKKGRVLFSDALYAFYPEVSDAVVVHELAHCFEQNHSKAFYDIVIRYCPEYYHYENSILSGMFADR